MRSTSMRSVPPRAARVNVQEENVQEECRRSVPARGASRTRESGVSPTRRRGSARVGRNARVGRERASRECPRRAGGERRWGSVPERAERTGGERRWCPRTRRPNVQRPNVQCPRTRRPNVQCPRTRFTKRPVACQPLQRGVSPSLLIFSPAGGTSLPAA